ncbi:hypothetical protein AB0O57_29080 [Streptomyces sp. NPDC091201]|uniref:hypothetical protein n=1 Tax=Streptomyces sp. NPDC091201 TaxID=3155190 RepID=UPI003444B45F
MTLHFTTFVLPPSLTGQPHHVPVIVFGSDTMSEMRTFPLPTSLHRIGNEVMPYAHATPGYPMPVTDAWIAAAAEFGDGHDVAGGMKGVSVASILAVQQPVGRDIETTYAPLPEGVGGQDLPRWLGGLLDQQLTFAKRDVFVSEGTDPKSIMMAVGASTSLPDWADNFVYARKD